jgi:hypothetical protein
MSRSDRSGYRPPWDDVRRAYYFAWRLDDGGRCEDHEREQKWADTFARAVDAFRPLRGLIADRDAWHGWPPRIRMDLRELAAFVDLVAEAWDWRWMDAPSAERDAERDRRLARFEEGYLRPVCEAAMAWEATDPPRDEWFLDVEGFYQIGRQHGWTAPSLTRDEAKQRFREAHKRYASTPRLGSCFPSHDGIAEDERQRTEAALNDLHCYFEVADPAHPFHTWREEFEPQVTPSAPEARMPSAPATGAGRALRELVESDPELRAALERPHSLGQAIRLVGRALQQAMNSPECRQAQEEYRQAIEEAAARFRAEEEALDAELAARGLPPPKNLEDWGHLARIVEMPYEIERSGTYTLGDVYDYAIAWAERQVAKARLTAGVTTAGSEGKPEAPGPRAPDDPTSRAESANSADGLPEAEPTGTKPPKVSGRKRRRKGEASTLLDAALDSLASKGQWGKTDTEILTLADISRDSFYRLIGDGEGADEAIKRKLGEYRRQTLGRGPARRDDL